MIQHTHFKFCPKCGRRGISAADAKSMHCKSCGYVYFHNCTAAVAGIVETSKGIILTVRNANPKKGKTDLPGGFTEYNESMEEALGREIKEELNIGISRMKYFGSFPNVYRYENVTYFTIDTVFICKPESLSTLRMNGEIAAVMYAKPEAIDFSRIGFPSTKRALRKYRALKIR
ncbi:MAG TPA: NUDIX domain-containing protein [Chitinivibrionales bacterium]|nr:NUDIX domain-containing protein [Chitinivibrionales bacterium]